MSPFNVLYQIIVCLSQLKHTRLLTGKKRRDHISPVLASLHWLPVHFRIQFKVLLIVFKCLNGLAPSYLSELVQPHSTSRALRSTNQLLLAVPLLSGDPQAVEQPTFPR